MLAGIQFDEGDTAVGVNEGLLVNTAHPFDIPHIVGILGAQVTGVLGFNFAMCLPFFFFALQGHQLGFGQDDAILRHHGLQSV